MISEERGLLKIEVQTLQKKLKSATASLKTLKRENKLQGKKLKIQSKQRKRSTSPRRDDFQDSNYGSMNYPNSKRMIKQLKELSKLLEISEAEKEELRSEVESLRGSLAIKLDSFGQEINPDLVLLNGSLKFELNRLKERYKDLQSSNIELQKTAEELEQDLLSKIKKIDELQVSTEKLQELNIDLQGKLGFMQEKIETLNFSNIELKEKLQTQRTQFSSSKKSLSLQPRQTMNQISTSLNKKEQELQSQKTRIDTEYRKFQYEKLSLLDEVKEAEERILDLERMVLKERGQRIALENQLEEFDVLKKENSELNTKNAVLESQVRFHESHRDYMQRRRSRISKNSINRSRSGSRQLRGSDYSVDSQHSKRSQNRSYERQRQKRDYYPSEKRNRRESEDDGDDRKGNILVKERIRMKSQMVEAVEEVRSRKLSMEGERNSTDTFRQYEYRKAEMPAKKTESDILKKHAENFLGFESKTGRLRTGQRRRENQIRVVKKQLRTKILDQEKMEQYLNDSSAFEYNSEVVLKGLNKI